MLDVAEEDHIRHAVLSAEHGLHPEPADAEHASVDQAPTPADEAQLAPTAPAQPQSAAEPCDKAKPTPLPAAPAPAADWLEELAASPAATVTPVVVGRKRRLVDLLPVGKARKTR